VTKAKADQTVGVRLELQSLERENLELLVGAHAVGDVLVGVGTLLKPFEGAITAFAVAYIAEKGIDAFLKTSADLTRIYNKSKTKVDALIEKCQKDNPGLSEQDCYARLMDRELSLWEKISLRAAGYTW
jgi:hypothetical protein